MIEAGTYALCANKGKKERIGRLLMMHANNREDVKIARTGDIIAVAGLEDVITGETLCDEKAPIILERMEFPGARARDVRAFAGFQGWSRVLILALLHVVHECSAHCAAKLLESVDQLTLEFKAEYLFGAVGGVGSHARLLLQLDLMVWHSVHAWASTAPW